MPDGKISATARVNDLKKSLGDDWTVETVGTGTSETEKLVKRLNPADLAAELGRLSQVRPWSANETLIHTLFGALFQKSHECPGRNRPQCCQASADAHCAPRWRERQDPEWYAQEINLCLSILNARIASGSVVDPRLAADEGFEIGCLVTEALKKFRWDSHARRGEQVLAAATEAGFIRRNSNPRRMSGDETVAAVDLLTKAGKPLMEAYAAVALEQGVKSQTIRKEYRRQRS